MRSKKKKKTFILLELLIAFALVSLFTLPFLREPYAVMKEEMDLLFQMEMEKRLDGELCALYDHILHNPPEFVDPEKGQETVIVQERRVEIRLSPTVKRNIDIVWKVCREKRKIDKETEHARYRLRIEFFPPNKRSNTIIHRGEITCIFKIPQNQ